MPLERVPRLTEFDLHNYNDAMARNYVDLIIQDYFKYLDGNAVARLKDMVVNLKGIEEEDLIRKIFSSLIDLPFSTKYSLQTNAGIKEGLTDICVLDFLRKYGILLDYETKYPGYVIFLREQLAGLGSKGAELELIFKGNIDQIISAFSLDEDRLNMEMRMIESHTTGYDILLHNIARLAPGINLEKYLVKLSASVSSKTEALQIMNDTIKEVMPEISIEASKLINAYLHPEEVTIHA